MCVDSPLVHSPSASCVTCVGDFLHCCSLIKELAVAQFSLFHSCMTGPPCSLAVIIRPIYCVCFQYSKLVRLSVFKTDLTNLEVVAHLHLGINSWHSLSVHFEYQVFPILSYKNVPDCTHVIYNSSTLYHI